MVSGVSKEPCYLDEGPDPHTRRGNITAGPEHARTCPTVDMLKATQQGAVTD